MCAPLWINFEEGARMNQFISNLGPAMEKFLDFKHALGIKYRSGEVYLRELDRYNLNHGNYTTLIKTVTEGWALEHAAKSTTEDRSWVSPIREFGRYLINTSDSNAYILDEKFVVKHYHAAVYLLTEKEIQRFFEECDRYVLRVNIPGRPYVFLLRYFVLCTAAVSGQ